MASHLSFVDLFLDRGIRDTILAHTAKEDILSLRLVCNELSIQTASCLFSNIEIEFRSSTFTRPARMAALERIGGFIETLTFRIAHSPQTFLPPLLDPFTGEEQTFVYMPQVHTSQCAGSRLSIPKYGSWEMTDLLTKQYPPLFHAATNIPSFIRAFTAMPSISHLIISCDRQVPGHRYRRSVVDYALISLRIAVEQAPLECLETLSLLPIHPAALLYLRHTLGFGASPSARKRWMQVQKLHIHMDSFPFECGESTDHLKLLHSYLGGFSSLREFTFRWKGSKGPCPLTLSTEPCLDASSNSLPLPSGRGSSARSKLRPLKFPSLRHMEVENVVLDASQVSSFIVDHRHTVREFNFEETVLRSGTWDEALEPLTRKAVSRRRRKKPSPVEVMDVPIMLSPIGMDARQFQKVLMQETKRKDRSRQFRAYTNFQRATSKTRGLLSCGPDHMRRFLRSSMFSWR
ncbi:uncharacterized protein CIMG_01651 [Coccidioides immitis RS]|uniref:Uncharacterized protein n=3 Tax=Coccidioides immitis TaxID=5501 RepID=J3KJM8_COCIM|nr:uncharacterized protein CIMG_01651 [Coccidioides immitis RS]EAS36297.3 hypothetical protein CIMG_01651 [Coccidioides immitis RS]KMP01644.1 hypothetical protein CIRG_01783 [Coccidioides immitis RMSCC 2394]KMU87639.1 hypothetical protein CIHG_06032 [Coccidioides immitis H538.4]